MNNSLTLKSSIVEIVKLALPILGGNLSQILISIADTIVAGRYSTVALGAISVASAIVMTVIIGAIGLVQSISPVISNYRGKKIPSKKYFKLNLVFSILVSIPFFLILEFLLFNIDKISLSSDMVSDIKIYISICSWSIFPSVIFIAVKEFLQSYERVVFANVLMFLTVIVNIILNIILTFGCSFIPEMGVMGLSYATLISRTLSAVLILLYCFPLFRRAFTTSHKYIYDLLKTGVPISFALFFEFLGFNLTAVLIGKFNSTYAAVHNIILCIANFAFMCELSVASAASVKIGYSNGANNKKNLIKYALSSLILIIFISLCTFLILIFKSDVIIKIFSNDPMVLELAKKIIKIVICFLFFDGIQCACVGILKGLKDTKIIAATMLSAYLLIAIPLGSYLAFCKNMVLEGFWSALALALFCAAIITSTRVILDIKKMRS